MSKSLADLIASESTVPVPTPVSEQPMESLGTPEEHTWAKDVLFVYNNQTTPIKKSKAWTPGQQGLLKVLKQDNTHFMSMIMPKAITLLEKARARSGDDIDVIRRERREIAGLQEILRDAIDEAARMK